MAVQAERLVLRHDVDLAQVAVNTVRKGDVDDAVLTCKRNGWLCPLFGEWEQPLAGSACQQHSKCVSHIQFPRYRSRLRRRV